MCKMEFKNVKKPHFWSFQKNLALTRKFFEKFENLKPPKNVLNAPKNSLGATSAHFLAHFKGKFGSMKKSHFEKFCENAISRPPHSVFEMCKFAHATHV